MPKAVESTLAGQPDKMCDQIADAIVDEYLRRDPKAQVDINVLGAHGMLMIAGEVDSTADFDCGALAAQVYKEIGYAEEIQVFVNLGERSPAMKEARARPSDTVVLTGYATRETREMLPRALVYAHTIARRVDELRNTDPAFQWLMPDGKVQLVMEGARVQSVTVLASHRDFIEPKDVQAAILDRVLNPVIGEEDAQVFVNPLGKFIVAGFAGDAGASGHKLSVDLYGGLIPSSDASLSGKDPGKVERAGTYMARAAARYVVAEGLAESAVVNVAYSLGRAEPVHLQVRGLAEKSRGAKMDLTNLIKQKFDFRPEAIVERLDLLRPIYFKTACYGHVGREEFPWET